MIWLRRLFFAGIFPLFIVWCLFIYLFALPHAMSEPFTPAELLLAFMGALYSALLVIVLIIRALVLLIGPE
ncbi:hypothetical protein [Paenibacillus rhizophilus]|uniref:Uncharacterized protein n=1 Tax=Paenibacillus rhizophilus TaxID=1850366 RepID=A0A3N9P9Y3_9BACL|nr:hypothetical protein [Paenibacillus rhizophilus]RQW13011.1 hypothetical protein EH198_00845 [Paenibacillus rhizophilus]